MAAVRPVLEAGYQPTGLPLFEAQFIAITEMAAVVAGRIGCGGAGPALHIHPCHQYYFMLSGSMRMQLGPDVADARAGSLICIPAGVAHCNWNDEADTETHLELLAPMVRPGQQHFTFVDSAELPPSGAHGYVTPPQPNDGTHLLTREGIPRDGLRITVATDTDPDTGAGDESIRAICDTDQLMFLIEGSYRVAVGADDAVTVAGPALVVLPTGAAHAVRRESAEARHLRIVAPRADGSPPTTRHIRIATVE